MISQSTSRFQAGQARRTLSPQTDARVGPFSSRRPSGRHHHTIRFSLRFCINGLIQPPHLGSWGGCVALKRPRDPIPRGRLLFGLSQRFANSAAVAQAGAFFSCLSALLQVFAYDAFLTLGRRGFGSAHRRKDAF